VADKETIRQNVRETFGRFMMGRELELAAELFHPDYVNHEANPNGISGPAGAVATTEWLHSCFGGLSFEVEKVLVEDDMAAAYVTMSGTHEGGLPPGLPATHRPFSIKHVHLVRFAEDGRALEHWAVRDDLGLATQAGLLPPAN
jgi:predicted ester cyclase